MLISKDNRDIIGIKKELFLERRIMIQGLAYSHVYRNRQSTEENALFFPF
jgi:hypothetical protein